MSRLRLDRHAAIALLSQSSDLLQNFINACRTALTESERIRWLVEDIIGSDQLKEEIKERRYQSLPKRKGSMVKPLLRTTERPVRKRGDEPMK